VALAPSAPAGTGAARRGPGGWTRILRAGEGDRKHRGTPRRKGCFLYRFPLEK